MINKYKLRKIFKNPYVFSIISKVCIVALGFTYSVCQSRYLGAALKGDVAYISSVTSITSIIFGCGIHQAYPYFKKKWNKNVAPLFTKIAIFMLVIYFIIALVLTIIFHAGVQVGAIFLLTPILVYNKIIAYINMVETPNKKNLTEMIGNIFEVAVVIALWRFIPATLISGIFVLVVKDVTLSLIYTYRLRNAVREKVSLEKGQVAEIFRFGIFPMMSLLMSTLNYRVDIIMLNHSVSSVDVGIYSVGVALAERVWLIPDALKEVMISNLAKGKGTDEVCFVIRICNIACLVVIAGIVLLGQPFINLFYGAEYSGAYSITVIILVGVFFMVYYKMIGAYNIVHGKQKENFIYLVISVICNITANAILIPLFGNIGAAFASIFSYGVSAFLFVRKFKIDNDVKLKSMFILNKEDILRVKRIVKK